MADEGGVDEDFRYGQLAIEGRFITPDQFDVVIDMKRGRVATMSVLLCQFFEGVNRFDSLVHSLVERLQVLQNLRQSRQKSVGFVGRVMSHPYDLIATAIFEAAVDADGVFAPTHRVHVESAHGTRRDREVLARAVLPIRVRCLHVQ